MNLRFAGTLFSSDQLNIGHFRAKGSPGAANIRFVGLPKGGLPPEFDSDCCPSGFPNCLLAVVNGVVADTLAEVFVAAVAPG